MKSEDFYKLFSDEDYCNMDSNGDATFRGLVIISNYIDTSKNRIIQSGHDVVYSSDISELIEAGISEEDANKLKEDNWFIDSECDCMAHWV